MAAVTVGVMFGRFFGVMRGVIVMAVRDVGVVPGLQMVAGFMMLRGFAMMLGGVFMVLGGFMMMSCG